MVALAASVDMLYQAWVMEDSFVSIQNLSKPAQYWEPLYDNLASGTNVVIMGEKAESTSTDHQESNHK